MSKKPLIETSLSRDARRLAREASVYKQLGCVTFHYPPTAGVINTMVRCIGKDLVDARGALLIPEAWSRHGDAMDCLRMTYGGNNQDYLFGMLPLILAPVDTALSLRITDTRGDAWVPDGKQPFDAWRTSHPGALRVVSGREVSEAERMTVMSRLLGSVYSDCMEVIKWHGRADTEN